MNVTKTISLHEDLAAFADLEAQEGGYGSVSAYFADLLRQRRQRQIDEDVAFLEKSIEGAPAGPEPVDEIVAACKQSRAQMRKEGWKP